MRPPAAARSRTAAWSLTRESLPERCRRGRGRHDTGQRTPPARSVRGQEGDLRLPGEADPAGEFGDARQLLGAEGEVEGREVAAQQVGVEGLPVGGLLGDLL